MFYIGVDVSKNSFNFCILNQNQGILRSKSLPISREGFEQFLKIASQFSPNLVVLESSGRFHITLFAFLLSKGLNVFVLNPKVVCRFRAFISANNPSKSDQKDSFILALFALANPHLLSPSSIPSETKLIARQSEKLKQEFAEAKTQVKQALAVLFPEAENHLPIFSKTFLSILSLYPSAHAIARAGEEKIAEIIQTPGPGRKFSLSPSELVSLAQNSIGLHHPGLEEILKFYVEKLLFLKPKIQKLEMLLKEEIEKSQGDQLKSLSSIKEISPSLAARFLAEVGEIKRFASAKKLIKYAGTDPVIKQSGKWKVEMGISKQGNPHL